MMKSYTLVAAISISLAGKVLAQAQAQEPWQPVTVELTPLPHAQVSMTVAGVEATRWHHGGDHPRPFFHPFNGPSGVSLTRMGHPGAPDHDHHCSIWFSHVDVGGVNFWANNAKTGGQIRQKQWLAYQDGAQEGLMAVRLGWYNAEGLELMEQEVISALRSLEGGERELEIQTTFRPPAGKENVVLGKTNFGLLAVRVAKSLSAHFGGGKLTSSEGPTGEPDIFGKPARWMDYSGPVAVGTGSERKGVVEGITFFDHPLNPRYPTKWHVRSDGWMGASFCMDEAWEITEETPLTLRYLLHAHSGEHDPAKAMARAQAFAERSRLKVEKGKAHRHFEVLRE
jgi:Methane oxygenase PmoA